MLTERIQLFLFGVAALIPLLGVGVLLWRRFYREDSENTARRIVKNSAIPTAIRLIVRAIDMAFALVLYRLLAPEAVGQYDLAALLVVQYLGTFSDFGLGTLLMREVARQPDAAPRFFGTTLVMRWLLSLAAVPMALALIGIYSAIGNANPSSQALTSDGSWAILILCLTLFPAAFNNVVTAVFNARERMEVPAAVELITQVVSVFARVGVLLAGWGVLGLAWAAVFTTCLTALIFTYLQFKLLFKPSFSWDWNFARSLLRPAFPLLLNSLLVNIAFSFDTFILRAFTDDLTVAQYRMPYRVINVALILPPLLTNAIFPLLARQSQTDRDGFRRTFRMALNIMLIASCPVVIGTMVLSSDLVTLFAGEAQYQGVSDPVLAILICFLPFSFVNGLIQYVLISLDRQSTITRAFVVMAVFNLLANFLSIPYFGLYAAAVNTILSELVLYFCFKPMLRREDMSLPVITIAWRPLLAALLMGGAMLLVYPLGGSFGWVLAGLVAPICYFALLWLLGTFGPDEQAMIKRVLRRS